MLIVKHFHNPSYHVFFIQQKESHDTQNTKAPQLVGEETKGTGAGEVLELLQSVQQPYAAGALRAIVKGYYITGRCLSIFKCLL